jgi:hypothetical protein
MAVLEHSGLEVLPRHELVIGVRAVKEDAELEVISPRDGDHERSTEEPHPRTVATKAVFPATRGGGGRRPPPPCCHPDGY